MDLILLYGWIERLFAIVSSGALQLGRGKGGGGSTQGTRRMNYLISPSKCRL